MSSVGSMLREAREKKKLTTDAAARATKIKKDMLEALENDDFTMVPAPTYAKGFLKIYATYLGLDPEEVVGEYLKNHTGDSEQVLVLDVEGKVKTQKDKRLILYAVIGAAAVLLIVIIALAVRGLRPSRKVVATPLQMEILEPSSVTVDGSDLLQPVVQEPPREMELRLKATKDVWVKVVVDGVTVFQNVIKKGGEEFWLGNSGFTMRVGRPDAVNLTLDGNPITISGKTSKPKTIEIDRDGNIEIPN